MKHHFETFETTMPLLTVTSQTAVECKIVGGGEFATLLSCVATAIPTGKEVTSGEFRYSGKLLFSVVYSDSDNQVRRLERGAEFSHSIPSEDLAPAYAANLTLCVVKTNVRRENGSIYATAIVAPTVEIFAPSPIRYLSETELVSKHEQLALYRRVPVGGMSETEDEFETEYLGDVLTHAEQLLTEKVEIGNGCVVVEGNVSLLITAWKEGGLCSFERLVPFRTELPYEGGGERAECKVTVRAVNLSVSSDEEKGKTSILTEITLDFCCTVWEKHTLDHVEDAYSTEIDVSLVRNKTVFLLPAGRSAFNERVVCPCVTNEVLDFSSTVRAITSVRATCDGETATVTATAILADKDGTLKKMDLSCPVTLPAYTGETELLVCGFKVSQRKEGELEAECTLKGCAQAREEVAVSCVGEVIEGESLPSPAHIRVILPVKGETLWELSKRLHRLSEEVSAQNPDLSFPMTGKERILLCASQKRK
ncbi:MAG: DUF3794 domain-containing protein [Clostridia bacterium]|nr:DUF3794 domain-containing protein [Clostridia bacterium]